MFLNNFTYLYIYVLDCQIFMLFKNVISNIYFKIRIFNLGGEVLIYYCDYCHLFLVILGMYTYLMFFFQFV